jgi:hypothetical protein
MVRKSVKPTCVAAVLALRRDAAQDDDLGEMHARARDPVHGLRGMVHGVEAPQERHAVEGAMQPVLREIR